MVYEKYCPSCSSPLVATIRPYAYHGAYLGRFPFLVCTVCRRVYHPASSSIAIEEAVKANGLWPQEIELEAPPFIILSTARPSLRFALGQVIESPDRYDATAAGQKKEAQPAAQESKISERKVIEELLST